LKQEKPIYLSDPLERFKTIFVVNSGLEESIRFYTVINVKEKIACIKYCY